MSAAPGVTYANLLDRIVENGGYILPDGTDMWTIRSVHPDLRSSRDYRWPFPGSWAEAPGPIQEDNTDPCPLAVGDGICVATTWEGMASGSIPAVTLLLCAINKADALSPVNREKIRVRRAYVMDVIDGARAIRELGAGTNLSGADLYRADLYWADLSGADLYRASLYRASLHGADLRGADLSGADLRGADLRGANLTGADLRGAHLYGANLYGARWDETTTWPASFDPAEGAK